MLCLFTSKSPIPVSTNFQKSPSCSHYRNLPQIISFVRQFRHLKPDADGDDGDMVLLASFSWSTISLSLDKQSIHTPAAKDGLFRYHHHTLFVET